MSEYIQSKRQIKYYQLELMVNNQLKYLQQVIDIMWLDIKTNIKQAKYLSVVKFDMQKIKKQTYEEGLDWNKGYYITEGELQRDNLLYIWGLKDLKVLNLLTGKPYYQFMGIARKENVLHSFLLLQQYRYFVLGYQNGQLKVWKLSEGKKIIHTYEGHTRPVDCLMLHLDPRLFWSCSSDQSVRLWSLDQFANIYTFTLNGIYNDITLLSYDKFMAEHNHMICLGSTNNNLKLIHTFGTKLISGVKKYDQNLKPDRLIFALDNNSGLSFESSHFEDQDLTKIPIGVFYPPPKSMGILDIQPSPYSSDEYIMLIEGGDLCLTKMDNGSGVMTQMQQSEQIQDFEGHQINQTASVIRFLDLEIPLYDADFGKGKQQNTSGIGQDELAKALAYMNGIVIQEEEINKLVAVGLSKGSLIFIQLGNMTVIHARMSYHRDRILSIETINGKILTICIEGYLKIVRIENKKPECLSTFDTHKLISRIWKFDNKLLFTTTKGQFQIFKFKGSELRQFGWDRGNEHEQKILCIDVLPERKCYITSGLDQKIKFWSSRKILVLQIVAEGELYGAWIINSKGDLLVAHDEKVSLINSRFNGVQKINGKQTNEENKEQKDKKQAYPLPFQEYYNMVHQNLKPITNIKLLSQSDQKEIVRENKQTEAEKQYSPNHNNQKRPIHKSSPPISYIGGKILLPSIENGKQTIIYRGKLPEKGLEQSFEKEKSKVVLKSRDKSSEQLMQHQNKKNSYFHDWDAFDNYEKSKKQKTYQISALPKADNAIQRQEQMDITLQMERSLQRRILTRRDITLNRIFIQNLLKPQQDLNQTYF